MNQRPEQMRLFGERVWHPYWTWEHWQAGVYSGQNNEEKAIKCAELLGDAERFERVARLALESWQHAVEHNLTNSAKNHQSFIGQVACCYAFRASMNETTAGWWLLTDEQRQRANEVADKLLRKIKQDAEEDIDDELP